MTRRFLLATFVTILASFPLPAAICVSNLFKSEVTGIEGILALLGLATLAAIVISLFFFLQRSVSTIEELSHQQSTYLDELPDRWINPAIFLSAG